jgi:hypothetical protein
MKSSTCMVFSRCENSLHGWKDEKKTKKPKIPKNEHLATFDWCQTYFLDFKNWKKNKQ